MDDRLYDALLKLSLTEGLGPTLIRRCIDTMGAATAVLEATVHQLSCIQGIGPRRAQAIRKSMDVVMANRSVIAEEKDLISEHGVTLLALGEPGYPRLLQHIPDAPPLLYVRGQLQDDDAVGVAIVGTRRCTAYGREQADRLSALCAQVGLCIVSGGARGVDGAAHRAALRVGGRTLAVMGSGLARPYPPEHRELFDTIATGSEGSPRQGNDTGRGGAVISEWPMNSPPLAEHFPRRNRIVAGLSLGVLVIEAPIRSGAMITARLASEEQGREVMALPGRVDSGQSTGCHKMIREGWATLVTNVGDILDALGEAGQLLKAGQMSDSSSNDRGTATAVSSVNMTDSQRRLFDALNEPRTIDQLCVEVGLPVSTVQADMAILEIRSLIARDQGRYRQR